MPDLTATLDRIDSMMQRGLIRPEDRTLLRQHLYASNDNDERLISHLVRNYSTEIGTHWKDMIQGLKSGTMTGEAGAAWSALNALWSLVPINAGLRTAGESADDWLVRHGASPTIAALGATIVDVGPQAAFILKAGAGALAKIAESGTTSAEQAAAGAQALKGSAKTVMDFMRSKLGYAKAATDERKAMETIAKLTKPAPLPSPASQVDVIRAAQDVALPGKGGVMQSERKLLPAPEVATGGGGGAESKIAAMNRTSSLLEAAQQSQVPPPMTSTSQTLQAAKDMLVGDVPNIKPKDVKAAASAWQSIEERMKGGTLKIIGGGAPSIDDYGSEMIKGAKRYQSLLQEYQGHGLTREIAEQRASELLSGSKYTFQDFMGMQPGQSRNPAETLVNVRLMNDILDKTFELRDKAKLGDSGAWDDLKRQLAELSGANPRYFGARSVAGQTLGEYRTPTTGTTQTAEQFHDFWSWMANANIDTPEDLERNKNRVLAVLSGFQDRAQIMQHANNMPDALTMKKPGWSDAMMSYFVNNVLSPITIGKKFTWDMAGGLYRGLVEKPTEAYLVRGLNRSLNTVFDNPFGFQQGDVAIPGEAMQFLYGWKSGWMKAGRYLLSRDWQGLAQAGQEQKRFMDLGDFLEERWGKPGAYLGDTVSWPTTAIRHLTNATRTAFLEAETRAQVFRQVALEGQLKGKDLASEVEARMLNVPPALAKRAVQLTDEYTFQGDLPGWASWINDGLNKFKLLRYEVPFWKTPINYKIFSWDRSPALSMLSANNISGLRQGGAPAAEALSRMMSSNILGGMNLLGARAGYITGGGDIGTKENQQAFGTGALKPYSILGPNGDFLSYHTSHPLGAMLGMAGDLGEIWNQLPDRPELYGSFNDAMGAFFLATGRNYLDDPSFQGLINFGRAIDDMRQGKAEGLGFVAPSKESRSLVGARTAEGFIPLAGTIKSFVRSADPAIQEAYTFMDRLKADFGFGDKPRINILGQTQYYPDTLGPRWLSSVSRFPAETDPLAKELHDLGFVMGDEPSTIFGVAAPGDPTKIVGPKEGIPLTNDEVYDIKKSRREAFGQQAREFFESPQHDAMNRWERLDWYNKISKGTLEDAKKQKIFDSPDLAARIQEGLDKKKMFMVTDHEQQAAQSNSDALGEYNTDATINPSSPTTTPIETEGESPTE